MTEGEEFRWWGRGREHGRRGERARVNGRSSSRRDEGVGICERDLFHETVEPAVSKDKFDVVQAGRESCILSGTNREISAKPTVEMST